MQDDTLDEIFIYNIIMIKMSSEFQNKIKKDYIENKYWKKIIKQFKWVKNIKIIEFLDYLDELHELHEQRPPIEIASNKVSPRHCSPQLMDNQD